MTLYIISSDDYDFDGLYTRLITAYPHLIEIKAQSVSDKLLRKLGGTSFKVAEFQVSRASNISIKKFCKRSPNLISLSLEEVDDEYTATSQAVHSIAKSCPRLEKLTLSDICRLKDKSGYYISSQCHLRELDLSECDGNLTDGIHSVVEKCPQLEVLKFQSFRHIDSIIRCAGNKCPSLRVFICAGCYVTHAAVVALVQGCPLLEELDLGYYNASDEVMHAVADNCPRLKVFNMGVKSDGLLTDQGLIALWRGCPDLIQLILLNKQAVTEATLLSFAEHCHKLQMVRVKHKSLACSSALCVLLASNPGLNSVTLDCSGLIHEVIVALAHACTKLETLSLEDCSHLTAEPLGMFFNRRCSFSLKHVHLANCTCVSDTHIDTLAHHCTRLESLSLNNCPNVTECSLASLFEFGKRLKTISMYGCDLHESDSLSRYYTSGTRKGYGRSGPRISVNLERWNTRYHWSPVYYEPHPTSLSRDTSSPSHCCLA